MLKPISERMKTDRIHEEPRNSRAGRTRRDRSAQHFSYYSQNLNKHLYGGLDVQLSSILLSSICSLPYDQYELLSIVLKASFMLKHRLKLSTTSSPANTALPAKTTYTTRTIISCFAVLRHRRQSHKRYPKVASEQQQSAVRRTEHAYAHHFCCATGSSRRGFSFTTSNSDLRSSGTISSAKKTKIMSVPK